MARGLRLGLIAAVVSAVLAAPAAASPYADAVLADQPGSYWRFGEPADPDHSGGYMELTDIAGGAWTPAFATIVGVPGALAGDPDTAIDFDGFTARNRSEFVTPFSPGAFNFGGRRPFTLETWMNPRNLNTHTRRVFSAGEWSGLGGVLVGVRADGLVFSRYAPGRWSTLKTPIRAGAWSHVVASYDGARMSLYVDGQLRVSAPSGLDVPPDPHSDRLSIGAKSYQFKYYAGTLDEPAVYPRALPAARVAEHYRVGTGG